MHRALRAKTVLAGFRRPRGVGARIVALGALLALSVVAVPVASATPGHGFSGQFGSGQLGNPIGVGVDQGSGEVYAAGGSVAVFTAAGDFVRSWGGEATPAGSFREPRQVATDGTSVYVADTDASSAAVVRFDTSGAYLGQLDPSSTPADSFSGTNGVAIDAANGDVYVADHGHNVVDRFDSSGAFVEAIGEGELAGPSQLAVDSNQNLYVVDEGNSRVVKYTAGVQAGTILANGPTGLAVNPADDHVFVTDSGPFGAHVTEYTEAGLKVSSFGGGRLASGYGTAVNGSTGDVYVADYVGATVMRFAKVTLPTVTTDAASGIDAANASLNGTVNPEGTATTYHFEWGADTAYGNSTPELDAGDGSSPVAVTPEPVSGLTPATTYHFRIVATTAEGSVQGDDQSFTTGPAQAAIGAAAPFASSITPAAATLNASVNPNGASTDFRFEYGVTDSYGSTTTPDGNAGSATGETGVSALAEGLLPDTVYHFRVVADNGIGGAVQGADATFRTAPAVQPSASELEVFSAKLTGAVNPQGDPGATYHFEYGPTTSYGTNTPETSTSGGSVDEEVTKTISGLAAGSDYHFRLVATVNGQTVSSDDATFRTLTLPEATVDPVTGLGETSATVHATVNTYGAPGALTLVVASLDSPYSTSSSIPLDAAGGPRSFATALSGLPAGQDYTVRAVVTAAGTTVYSDLLTFTTLGKPVGQLPKPPNISNNPYGCTTPHLDPVKGRPKAGRTAAITGTDLGVTGTVKLGNTTIDPSNWSDHQITFKIPAGASGKRSLTANCGTASNTVSLTVAKPASNRFTLSAKTLFNGATATLRIRVPGPGKLRASGTKIVTTQKTIHKARIARIVVRLTRAAKRPPARRTTAAVRIRFTPAGGKARTKIRTLTFKRGGTR
jgi:DNA-binding beta-propeller fold protein YncE